MPPRMNGSQRPRSMIFPTGYGRITPDQERSTFASNFETGWTEHGDQKELLSGDVTGDEQRQIKVLRELLLKKDQSISRMTTELDATKADKDQLEKLFDGSQLENQKCLQQINDFREHVKTLEAALVRINGPGWREDFSIPPTPGPRSLGTPMRNTRNVAQRKFPFDTAGAGSSIGHAETDEGDDTTEEVVDSMRRYANGTKAMERNEAGKIGRIRSPLVEQLDDDTLSAQGSSDEEPVDISEPKISLTISQPTPVKVAAPTAIDLQPVISVISSLHASSHAQSSELVTNIIEKHEQRLALDRANWDESRQTVVQQVQDAQAEVAKAWEDMRQQDDVREQNLKQLLETAIKRLELFDNPGPSIITSGTQEVLPI